MFKRKIYNEIKKWKEESNGRKSFAEIGGAFDFILK